MRFNDQQLARPETAYTNTKANIAALSGVLAGSIAYATDTQEKGVYNGTSWDWFKPSNFANAIHTHSGGDITTAVVNATNADTLDTLHSKSFHRTQMGDINGGALNFNNCYTQGQYLVAATNAPGAPYAGTLYGTLTVVSWNGETADGSSNWIYQYWHATDGNRLWRQKVNAGAWTTWYKEWTQQLQGHSSGLDADRLDGNEASAFASSGHNHDSVYVPKTSAARPGVYKLYRNEADDAYNVQTYWTGSYWKLQGYLADTYHAGCQVAYADYAPGTIQYTGELTQMANQNLAPGLYRQNPGQNWAAVQYAKAFLVRIYGSPTAGSNSNFISCRVVGGSYRTVIARSLTTNNGCDQHGIIFTDWSVNAAFDWEVVGCTFNSCYITIEAMFK